ncbi:YqaJ-like viral recombinase domain protein [Vibrio thalassae]|uniref:YqaJ-like viral recombinase domain protein n=1 Tax=Vibrio thalassae TaxID=1243014 RepID=A0A240EGX7_9VIBR|nr:YqaJ viral recombinase family protein [Vibrio thalassae]SNX47225.1 YqaJ-like viral recombinase domain protein [Vibrio thalassae]
MILVRNELVQDTDEWRAWRDTGIGGSDVPVIMGDSKYKTLWCLWAEKLGIKTPDDFSRNPHVRRGKYFEPLVLKTLAVKLGVTFSSWCGHHIDYPHRKVSFDGVAKIAEKYIPAEIKCPCDTLYDDLITHGLNSELVKQHRSQLVYQIGLLEAPYGFLVFYFEHNNDLKIFRINADKAEIENIFDSVDAFFENNVVPAIAPQKDPDRDYYEPTAKELLKWDQQTLEFIDCQKEESDLKKQLKEVSARKRELASELTGMASEFKMLSLHGIKITTVKGRETFDTAKYLESKGITISDSEREQFTKVGNPSYRVSAIKNRNNLDSLKDDVLINQRKAALALFKELPFDDETEDLSFFE